MSKVPTPTEKFKKQRENKKNATKTSITQRLRNDLGRSVGVTIATKVLGDFVIVLSQISNPKVPNQANTKRDGIINPQNYNFIQF